MSESGGSVLMRPPEWVLAVAFVGTLVFGVVLAYRLHGRDWYVSPEEQSQMLIVAGTVLSVGTATLAVSRTTDWGFLWVVAGGFLLGYTIIVVVNSQRVADWVATYLESPHERRAAAWTAIVPTALFLPWLFSPPGEYVAPIARSVLCLMALAMIALNAHAEQLDAGTERNTSG